MSEESTRAMTAAAAEGGAETIDEFRRGIGEVDLGLLADAFAFALVPAEQGGGFVGLVRDAFDMEGRSTV